MPEKAWNRLRRQLLIAEGAVSRCWVVLREGKWSLCPADQPASKEAWLAQPRFSGNARAGTIRQVIGESDILLHPSRLEGIPRVILEAGATAMPSIVFDYYQTPSVIDGITDFR